MPILLKGLLGRTQLRCSWDAAEDGHTAEVDM